MGRLLTIAALVFASAPAARAQEPTGDLALRIGIHSQQSTGRFAGFAGDSGIEPFESYAWANETLCLLSASVREPATIPAVGWFFRGRVIKRTGAEFLVDIEWARLWDHSTRLTNGPKGSMQVTLRTGEPLTLDEVTPAAGGCPVIGARLEAAILPQMRPRRLVGGGGGAGGGWGGASAGPVGAGSGAATGGIGTGASRRAGGGGAGGTGGGGTTGGGAVGAAAGGGSTGPGAGTSAGGSTGDAAQRALSAQETYRRQFNAEVWLVHKLPSGVENVQRVTFVFGRTPAQFSFPPIEVVKDGTRAVVDIGGTLALIAGEPETKLFVVVGRDIRRDPQTDRATVSGGSGKTIALPAEMEVIAFELPSAPSEPAALAGHQFSVRLRVTPR